LLPSSGQSLSSSGRSRPSSNKPRGKRQASSPPGGKRSGQRQRPPSPKRHATGPQTRDVGFYAAVDDTTRRPQSQSQLHQYDFPAVLDSELLPVWNCDPLSADPAPAPAPAPALASHLQVPGTATNTTATGAGRRASTGPGSLYRSDGGSTTTDPLPRPNTPLYVATDGTLPAGLDAEGGFVFGHYYDKSWQNGEGYDETIGTVGGGGYAKTIGTIE
jgi:hypothetical protein